MNIFFEDRLIYIDNVIDDLNDHLIYLETFDEIITKEEIKFISNLIDNLLNLKRIIIKMTNWVEKEKEEEENECT
ncbi:MAG TPA: hypothetical protein VFC60_00460 [Tissierellaceae bacterium]|nr:hypothetical protein [Tissierellaceae bacterium]